MRRGAIVQAVEFVRIEPPCPRAPRLEPAKLARIAKPVFGGLGDYGRDRRDYLPVDRGGRSLWLKRPGDLLHLGIINIAGADLGAEIFQDPLEKAAFAASVEIIEGGLGECVNRPRAVGVAV